jgi:hypothetical protein
VDSSDIPFRSHSHAIFDGAAGGVHGIPIGIAGLLAKHPFAGATLYWSWVCAIGSGLVKEDVPAPVSSAIKRRIVIAQSLYAFGALLCVVNPYWSIGFIVLVQLNYVVAPRFGQRD